MCDPSEAATDSHDPFNTWLAPFAELGAGFGLQMSAIRELTSWMETSLHLEEHATAICRPLHRDKYTYCDIDMTRTKDADQENSHEFSMVDMNDRTNRIVYVPDPSVGVCFVSAIPVTLREKEKAAYVFWRHRIHTSGDFFAVSFPAAEMMYGGDLPFGTGPFNIIHSARVGFVQSEQQPPDTAKMHNLEESAFDVMGHARTHAVFSRKGDLVFETHETGNRFIVRIDSCHDSRESCTEVIEDDPSFDAAMQPTWGFAPEGEQVVAFYSPMRDEICVWNEGIRGIKGLGHCNGANKGQCAAVWLEDGSLVVMGVDHIYHYKFINGYNVDDATHIFEQSVDHPSPRGVPLTIACTARGTIEVLLDFVPGQETQRHCYTLVDRRWSLHTSYPKSSMLIGDIGFTRRHVIETSRDGTKFQYKVYSAPTASSVDEVD